jgi:outer membrane protein assembly factor BamB
MPDNMSSTPSNVWTLAGGGPGRAGLATHRHKLGSRPAHTLTTDAGIQSAVVFDGEGRAFVASMGGRVLGFGAEWRQLWKQDLEGAISATPAVQAPSGRLFAGTHSGWVYGLNSADGKVLWRVRLPSMSDSRIVADLLFLPTLGRLVVNSWGGQCHELDPASGNILRSWDAGISPQSAPSADSRDHIYQLRAVRDEGTALVRVAPDGRQTVLHRTPEGERRADRSVVMAAPVIAEDRKRLFFVANGDRKGMLHAWDLEAERLDWSVEFERAVVATPALRPDGVVMVADMTGALLAVEAGRILFRYSTGSDYLLAGPVCDAVAQTYLGDTNGQIHRVDAGGAGQVVFEADRAIQARPAWAPGGELCFGSMDGRVHVFGPAVPTA